MKRLGKFAALFTAITIAFTGCNAPNESAPESSAAPTQTAEALPTAETAEPETAAPETNETAPAAISMDSEKELVTYSEPDEGHVFVDFDYIENAEGITDPEQAGEWLDKALETLQESEYYKALADFDPSEDICDNFDPEEYFDDNWNPAPRFERAFTEDFDGDGDEESFVVLTMPARSYPSSVWWVRYFLIYVGNSCTKSYECLPEIFGYHILDYGVCKQLIVYTGGLGVETGSTIYGVKDGVSDILYSFRGGYNKVDCFLSGFGHQGGGDFMYYDTAAKEYRAIDGKEMTFEEAFAMDTSGSLSEEKRRNFVEGKMLDTEVVIIGEKYYCFDYGLFGTGEPYTYENGTFTKCESGTVRISRGWTYDINHVEDINYDEAAASMLTPAQAREKAKNGYLTYSQPDEGHVFVDFDYIENAEGITDPEQAGDYLSKALEVLKKTEEYKAFEEYVRSEDYDSSQFSEYVKDGYPVPQFKRAFIDDFDNNGTNEAFITFDFPTLYDGQIYGKVRCFTIYVGVNNTQICEIWSGSTYTSGVLQYDIIDYGLCKQLVIHTSGLGVEQTGAIFGVDNDMPENLFNLRSGYEKVDCFLSAIGWQSSGCFMYYDTAAKEYRAIKGKDLDSRDVLAMDTTGSLDKFKDNGDMLPAEAVLIGGKYYVLNYEIMDIGTPFIYENGEFIEQSGCYVRNCHLKMTSVEDIDYDAAVTSMLTPAQAALL